MRYTKLNPVRAQLVTDAHAWAWSSAAAHCATVQVDAFLSMELWQNHWTNASWRDYLAAGETETELASIRQCTRIRAGLWHKGVPPCLESVNGPAIDSSEG